MNIDQRSIDEVLEAVWVARESNQTSEKEIKAICDQECDENNIDVKALLKEMTRLNFLKVEEEKIKFLPKGEREAKGIIRRHRLAEQLFSEVLQVSETSMELTACRFEHILNSEITNSVCAFLGHPPLCPHGKLIPPGACCKTFERDRIKPLVFRLTDIELGKEGVIAFISPSFHKRFDRLTALGVITGNRIIVHQKEPSFVIRIGKTELAIDRTIANEIFVKAL